MLKLETDHKAVYREYIHLYGLLKQGHSLLDEKLKLYAQNTKVQKLSEIEDPVIRALFKWNKSVKHKLDS